MRPDRIETDESVLVDIIACKDPDLLDTHLSGRTMDVSESGMKVTMMVQVPEHTRLGLRLDMNSKVFRLEGDVRWTRNDGEMSMGIKLNPDSPDYEQWMKLFEMQMDMGIVEGESDEDD